MGESLLDGHSFDVASVASSPEVEPATARTSLSRTSLGRSSLAGPADEPVTITPVTINPVTVKRVTISPVTIKPATVTPVTSRPVSLSGPKEPLERERSSLRPQPRSLRSAPQGRLEGKLEGRLEGSLEGRGQPRTQARTQVKVKATTQVKVKATTRAKMQARANLDPGSVTPSEPLLVPSVAAMLPDKPHGKDLGDLRRWAERQWDLAPGEWVEGQLVRLALASLLEARLLHLSSSRLDAFTLGKDPEGVTLAQLSHLWRQHHGESGQAFELAVADAVEAGVPEVVDPLRQAMLMLGAKDVSSIRMRVLGLEKVDRTRRREFAEAVLQDVHDGAVLRTGRRGRPMSGNTAMGRIGQQTWSSMSAPSDPDGGSQMARADALLFTDRDLFLASMKVNRLGVMRHRTVGWQDVPLWITRSTGPETTVRRVNDAKHPMVVVSLGDTRWTRAFDEASRCLWVALHDADMTRRRPNSPGVRNSEIPTRLYEMRHLPIAEVCRRLRQTHPGVQDLFGPAVRAQVGPQGVPVPELKPLRQGWLGAAEQVPVLLSGQQHVFLRAPAKFDVGDAGVAQVFAGGRWRPADL